MAMSVFSSLPPSPISNWPQVVTRALPPAHHLRGSVLLLGNFDGFHLGHQALARLAREIAGDGPVAVMSCEPHPRSFFGRDAAPFRLVTPGVKQRLIAPYAVDFLYSPQFDHAFANLTPAEFVDHILVETLGVRAVIAGPDFRFARARVGDMVLMGDLCRPRGIAVHQVDEVRQAGVKASSTLIRSAIRAGDLRRATGMLGGSWLIETETTADGRMQLHHDLCRPLAGHYIGAPDAEGGAVRICISADGGFAPLRPFRLGEVPRRWRLHASD
jgi:riboflavin kinase/FMN adenylyltransferase